MIPATVATIDMRISNIYLENYRAHKLVGPIRLGEMHVIVGKNDISKSSKLWALDTFLNGGTFKLENLTVGCAENDATEVRVCFADFETAIKDRFD